MIRMAGERLNLIERRERERTNRGVVKREKDSFNKCMIEQRGRFCCYMKMLQLPTAASQYLFGLLKFIGGHKITFTSKLSAYFTSKQRKVALP